MSSQIILKVPSLCQKGNLYAKSRGAAPSYLPDRVAVVTKLANCAINGDHYILSGNLSSGDGRGGGINVGQRMILSSKPVSGSLQM